MSGTSGDRVYADAVAKFHASALQAHDEAEAMIQRAREWAVDFSDMPMRTGDEDYTTWFETNVTKRADAVTEMERSYHRALLSIVMRPNAFDGGELQLSRDGEGCLFFRYPKSGYVGGIIFHRSGEGPCGTWNVHT